MKARPARIAAQPAPVALPPGHRLLADLGQVVRELEAQGYTVQGMEWNNKAAGVPVLVVRPPVRAGGS